MPSRESKRWQHRDINVQMRKVRKHLKRNRKTKHVRHKEWRNLNIHKMPDDPDEFDALYEVNGATSERVMPRGERERRQAAFDAALAAIGQEQDANEANPVAEPLGERGTVIEISSSLCRVRLDGRVLVCVVRGSLSAEDTGYTNVVAVGDEVVVSEDGGDRGAVEAVLPRRSALARPDVWHSHLRQVIVANADQLLVVASYRDPKFWPELVDRYLIAAERSGLASLICVNKTDLAPDLAACRAEAQPYLDLGHPILFTSAVSGEGIEELAAALHGQTTVLAGMSGVGKSSLLNAVQPGMQLRTAEVSDWSHTGRHTTSQVNLLELATGGCVVDTPGIREFGLSGLRRGDLIQFYPELAAVDGQCRFGDCSHTHEPGCAIKAALRQGSISKARYGSYRAISASLPETRADEREKAQTRAWR